MRTGDGTGPGQDLVFPFGGFEGDVPLMGDWNGDGISKPALPARVCFGYQMPTGIARLAGWTSHLHMVESPATNRSSGAGKR